MCYPGGRGGRGGILMIVFDIYIEMDNDGGNMR
jgi:hypothetical protein